LVKTEAGETLRLLTNDLDAPAHEIADLYKRRWQIELFFRLMKQTLRITKFVGRSENAVRIQIAVALIAFLLLRALQQVAKDACGFLELVRLAGANLMHRKDPTRLKNPPPSEPLDPSPQLEPDSRGTRPAMTAFAVFNPGPTANALRVDIFFSENQIRAIHFSSLDQEAGRSGAGR
jgi:hypothetical protein